MSVDLSGSLGGGEPGSEPLSSRGRQPLLRRSGARQASRAVQLVRTAGDEAETIFFIIIYIILQFGFAPLESAKIGGLEDAFVEGQAVHK